MALVWSVFLDSPRILHILLPSPEKDSRKEILALFPVSKEDSCQEIRDYAEKIGGFLEGGNVSFSTDILRLDLCPDFRRKALLANFAVPRGKVSTYGHIARHLGSPGAGRAVGTAMSTNPFPIAIPCHRIVSSDLSMGGYGGGLRMKKAFLDMEGVIFSDDKNISEKSLFIWKN